MKKLLTILLIFVGLTVSAQSDWENYYNTKIHPRYTDIDLIAVLDSLVSGSIQPEYIADSSITSIKIADSVLVTLKDPIDSTGNVYTARIASAGRMIFLNNADSTIVTIHSDTAFYENSVILFVQEGAGFVKIVEGGSANFFGKTNGSSEYKTSGQGAVLGAYRRSNTNNWLIWGDNEN